MAESYKNLKIWNDAIVLVSEVYALTKKFPKDEIFGMTSQLRRAVISISSNIAEGSSRTSDKDYNRFVEISLGSSFELETQLLIAKEVNYGNEGLINTTLELLAEEEKMLTAFSNTLSDKK